jgi:hypothetical protein
VGLWTRAVRAIELDGTGPAVPSLKGRWPYLTNKFRLADGFIHARLFAVLLLSGALAALSAASAEGSSASHSEGGYVPHFVAIVRQYSFGNR